MSDFSAKFYNESIFRPGTCVNARGDVACQTWKSQGHCEGSPEVMKEYCLKECGFCDVSGSGDNTRSVVTTDQPTSVTEVATEVERGKMFYP